ncbi:MAG TPA: DUF2917 domain-containing protein [Burkholderiales bacterium]|nr:DUF2917 domain-containing protein [Burkholderiales bacterium]
MMLRLTLRDFLSLQGARGMAIDVLVGRVWITEDGRTGDSFVDAGRSYRVGGQGLVLIGAETRAGGAAEAAEVVVRHAAREALLGWLRNRISGFFLERQTRGELSALPDRMLKDIGLRRDQLDRQSFLRR